MADGSRPEFRLWVDSKAEPGWGLMPLTHITKGLIACDIVRDGQIKPQDCDVRDEKVAYFFYGRPAYRVSGDGSIKQAATCPFCFIFDPQTITQATNISALDTGAFAKRLYSHSLMEEMDVGDFSLETDFLRPNRLINSVYGSREEYFIGNSQAIPDPDKIAAPGDFLAQAYVRLLRSEGRNEPDDRVGTVEVSFTQPVDLHSRLLAVVVPDILWKDNVRTDWLGLLDKAGVAILPFRFSVGREAGYHHALIEQEVRRFYEKKGFI